MFETEYKGKKFPLFKLLIKEIVNKLNENKTYYNEFK